MFNLRSWPQPQTPSLKPAHFRKLLRENQLKSNFPRALACGTKYAQFETSVYVALFSKISEDGDRWKNRQKAPAQTRKDRIKVKKKRTLTFCGSIHSQSNTCMQTRPHTETSLPMKKQKYKKKRSHTNTRMHTSTGFSGQ